MPFTNKENGSQYWTLNYLGHRFYYSKFNRDNLHDLKEGEDINYSRMYRLYNKTDIKELLHHLADYLEWALVEENLGKIYITDNIELVRKPVLPYVRRANQIEEIVTKGGRKAGICYLNSGKYTYQLTVAGDLEEKLADLAEKDPQFIKKKEELQSVLEERNKGIIDEDKQD